MPDSVPVLRGLVWSAALSSAAHFSELTPAEGPPHQKTLVPMSTQQKHILSFNSLCIDIWPMRHCKSVGTLMQH